MTHRIYFTKSLIIFIVLSYHKNLVQAQNINLKEYDIFIADTLINKSEFLEKGKELDSGRLKYLTFKPITDGQKKIYYLGGQLYAQGEIKGKKENGLWVYWYENGKKAREGNFDQGNRIGTHTYWYQNGNLRGVGNFKNDKYNGKWTMYNEEGQKTEQFYKEGKLVK